LTALLISLISLREKVVIVGSKKMAKGLRKERKRYVLFQIMSTERVKDQECLQKVVEMSIERMYGKVGLALVSPKVVYYDMKTNNVIVRCRYEGKDILIASSILPQDACGTKVKLIPIRSFGTLRSARERIPKVGQA